MASLCILHNDRVGVRGAFSAVATPQRDASEFASANRTKIWELSSTLQCSIVGTCLTASERRRFFIPRDRASRSVAGLRFLSLVEAVDAIGAEHG